jgi:hypothetical protein
MSVQDVRLTTTGNTGSRHYQEKGILKMSAEAMQETAGEEKHPTEDLPAQGDSEER